jgi:hypothetical protein
MRQSVFSMMAVLLSLTVVSCEKEDTRAVEPAEETGEVFINTCVDDKLQTATKATVYLDGGYATGAGKYPGNTDATVAAYANTGYKLESFTGENNKYSGASSYTVRVASGVTYYFTARFKKQDEKGKLNIYIGAGQGAATGWEADYAVYINDVYVGEGHGPGIGNNTNTELFTYEGANVKSGATVKVIADRIFCYYPGRGTVETHQSTATMTLSGAGPTYNGTVWLVVN